MKKEIKIVVFNSDSYVYDLPNTANKFMEWWEEKFNLCPPEYKDDLKIDYSTEIWFDSSCLNVEIYYWRLENDEEYAIRLEQEQVKMKEMQKKDLAEFERLKAIYGV